MEINEKPICLNELFSEGQRYQIPRFQRYYAWRKKNWKQLWLDIHNKLSANKKPHFMGVIITAGGAAKLVNARHNVIDGQQRLTTLSVFLCAMRDVAKEKKFAGDWCKNITDKFLIYPSGKGVEKFNILLRYRNRAEYESLINGTATGENADEGILGAHAFFVGCISDHVGNGEGAVQKFKKLEEFVGSNLVFVSIALDKGENIYKIFKSLNSTGQLLSHGDLIRNHVFSSVSPKQEGDFDRDQWQPLEDQFGRGNEFNEVDFTSFLRHSIQRRGIYVPPKEVSAKFEEKYGNPCTPEDIVRELNPLADHYLWFTQSCPDPSVEVAIKMVRDLPVRGMVAPLLLRLLELYHDGNILTKDDLIASAKDVAGFVLRRYICGEDSRSYQEWCCDLCGQLGEGRNALKEIREFFREKGWPDDKDFKGSFVERKTGRYGRAILNALSGFQQDGEPVDLTACSIEHVMPRTPEDGWQRDLGNNWESDHEKWLHTPGNLTLLKDGFNKGMKNAPYKVKKAYFARSNVSLNNYFASVNQWTAAEIKARGEKLAEAAIKIWPKAPPKSK